MMPAALSALPSWAQDAVRGTAVLSAFLVAMVLVRLFWRRIVSPLASRTKTQIDDVVLLPLRSLVLWGLFLLGLSQSARAVHAVRSMRNASAVLDKGLAVAWVLVLVWTAVRLVSLASSWYQHRELQAGRDLGSRVALIRKVSTVLVFALGLLYLLRILNVDISPLLAGGAIGGLAVALALQDTLSNVFAGFYLAIDRPISVGDFIKLESGEEGFVEEIGWRNTKVRLWANNVVVIPNSKLSQSVLTNYYLPQQETSVYVPCGVSYDSDLEQVERVTVEVARQVMREVPGSSTDWDPVVRWKEFGDFAITFVTVLRVREFPAQYSLQSEFIKALHRRFREEDIEIPFPIRTVLLKPLPDQAAPDLSNRADWRPVS